MVRMRKLILTFLRVGTFGFGGGVGMLAMIRTECVKRAKWITDEELSVAVALGQMVPGPFVPHYCQYIGQKLHGLKGSIAATVALLLPSFILLIILSYLYFMFRTLPGIEHVFKGIGAVMTAIILWASYDMGKVLIREARGIIIFCLALLLFLIKFDPVLTVITCGLLAVVMDNVRSPRVFLVVPVLFVDVKKLLELFWIFFKIGAVIFGGGYAAIPFIQNEVCTYRSWLTVREFMDGVALGQITPGPVAITATFVGFKVMGIIGALVATIGIFLPSFLMLIVFIKIYRKIEHNKYVISFFAGIKAAVVAILLSTGIFFIMQNWWSVPYAMLGIACLVVLLFLKIEPVFLIIAGVIFGLIIK
jgi:chromate transporter